MLDHTIASARGEQFVATMTESITALAQSLSRWTLADHRLAGYGNGTHRELIGAGGMYSKLHHGQVSL